MTFVYFNEKDLCLKARQNYLDHFSSGGKLAPETKSVHRPPSFNLINRDLMIIFEVSCEGYKMDKKWSWDKLKHDLILNFGTDSSEIIENGCISPITWENNKK